MILIKRILIKKKTVYQVSTTNIIQYILCYIFMKVHCVKKHGQHQMLTHDFITLKYNNDRKILQQISAESKNKNKTTTIICILRQWFH